MLSLKQNENMSGLKELSPADILRRYNHHVLRGIHPKIFENALRANDLFEMRTRISRLSHQIEVVAYRQAAKQGTHVMARVRDCAQVFRSMLTERADRLTGFSVAQAIWDIARDVPRPDLKPGFFAELQHIILGMQGKSDVVALEDVYFSSLDHLSGRPAAKERSRQLDELKFDVDRRISHYVTGLEEETIARRQDRKEHILQVFGATEEQWHDWRWQVKNVVKDVETLENLVSLSREERAAVVAARHQNLPFGITPYYLSLMDNEASSRDAAIRAQVLPPMNYVRLISSNKDTAGLDFMGEEDTSPHDLITRRYPGICILKPYNTCPQICVYCQRNWEIDDVMAAGAYAGRAEIDGAIQWIADHPAIHEVLITGGDPLAMGDKAILDVVAKVAEISTVERIRIGTRTLVTLPMRINDDFAEKLSRFRIPGKREIVIMTHVQHPYEITPDLVAAVDRLKTRGISVYNQMVYTFYVSRRFEAAALRRLLRLAGIDPYYTFNTKGKDETLAYRVPISRLMQEQDEEARLQPGLERTDEAVFNVPRLGKNYLKSREHRALLTIMPDGARVSEFFSWEKNISNIAGSYVSEDVPILDYLVRLHEEFGEDMDDYATIWYYF